jgi:prepilin-type N-terminal cleavage/methylation domain-containing protein
VRRGDPGFTLVELLAVLSIILFLSAIGMPVYAKLADEARRAKSKKELKVIEGALEQYKAERGHYPDRLNRLVEYGYLKRSVTFRSPWWSSTNKVYYFYAANLRGDGRDYATAYALGEPGARAKCGLPDRPGTSPHPILHQGEDDPTPCGRHPDDAAWVFGDSDQPTIRLCVRVNSNVPGATEEPCKNGDREWVKLLPASVETLAGFCCPELITEGN